MNADFVLLGGRVATMDGAGTECTALAALNGRIVALGDDHAMREHVGPGTTVLHAEGRRVLPGIVASNSSRECTRSGETSVHVRSRIA